MGVAPRRRGLALSIAAVVGAALCAGAAENPAVRMRGAVADTENARLVMPGRPAAFGITDTSILTIPAFAFQSYDGSPMKIFPPGFGDYNRYSPSQAAADAAVVLPTGASITDIELEGCDGDPIGKINFLILSVAVNGTTTNLSDVASTGIAETPGCSFFVQSLLAPHTVDNLDNTYLVEVLTSHGTGATNFSGVRVYYKLQVSPAPAVSTFSDVSTSDPAFSFIEAFAGAGITAGCQNPGDPPKFCPDATVTRRQMAVFFAKALGLHWPL